MMLVSCGRATVSVAGVADCDGEKGFCVQLLGSPEARKATGLYYTQNVKADIVIQLSALWENESAPEDIIISRRWYVPASDPVAGRWDTSFERCRAGGERLIPLELLKPPSVALRVDGRVVGDEAYALKRVVRAVVVPKDARFSLRAERLRSFLRLEQKPLSENSPALLWVAAAGDLLLERGAGRLLRADGGDAIFGKTAPILQSADIAIVNLEGALSRRGERTEKHYTFRSEPEYAFLLAESGIDAVLLANNHAFDWGRQGLVDTVEALGVAGIAALGAGNTQEEACAGKTVAARPGVRLYGIACYPKESGGWDGRSAAAEQDAPGINFYRDREMGLVARQFTPERLDIVVVHGGEEWTTRPEGTMRRLCVDLAHGGADLIIGSHPHVVQGFEWVGDTPVFWSLGNFVFPGMEGTPGGEEGLLVSLAFLDNRLVYLEPYPVRLAGQRSDLDAPEKLASFLNLSRALKGTPSR